MVAYLALKLVLMFVIFIEGLLGGALPVVERLIKHPNTIQYLNSFGGGVIFSVGIIHLLKEGSEQINEYCGPSGCDAGYPFIIMVLSYLFMLLLMRVLAAHSHSITGEHNESAAEPLANRTSAETNSEEKVGTVEKSSINAAGLMTFFSLAMHGIFLGLALGIDRDLTGIINTAIGVLAHKWADTLALAMSLRRSKSRYLKPSVMVPLQSLVTPLGIMIGMFISEAKNLFVEGFFLCMTAGCFNYFFATDIAVEVFQGKGKLVKFALVLLGVSVFTVALSVGEHYSGG